MSQPGDAPFAGPPRAEEPLEEWVDDAVAWLAVHATESLALETALRLGGWRGAWHLAAHQTPQGIEALSLVTGGGRWFLESRTEAGALHLLAFVAHGSTLGRPLVRLDTSATAKEWVRELLAEAGRLRDEEDLSAMLCRRPPERSAGHWATEADLPRLAALAGEREPAARRDWAALVAERRVALLAEGERSGSWAVVLPPSSRFAAIGEVGGVGEGAAERSLRLLGFVVRELLADKEAVHHLAPVGGSEELALFSAAGFAPVGGAYRAWLR